MPAGRSAGSRPTALVLGEIVAKRKLDNLQRDLGKVDVSQGRLTLRALCDRYLLTTTNQVKDTVVLKTTIVKQLLADFAPVQTYKWRK